ARRRLGLRRRLGAHGLQVRSNEPSRTNPDELAGVSTSNSVQEITNRRRGRSIHRLVTTIALATPLFGDVPRPARADHLSLEILGVTSPVERGLLATLQAQTTPGAWCEIAVWYKSGRGEAEELQETLTAGDDGLVGWTWKVGGNTTPGEWPIDVSCSLDG